MIYHFFAISCNENGVGRIYSQCRGRGFELPQFKVGSRSLIAIDWNLLFHAIQECSSSSEMQIDVYMRLSDTSRFERYPLQNSLS